MTITLLHKLQIQSCKVQESFWMSQLTILFLKKLNRSQLLIEIVSVSWILRILCLMLKAGKNQTWAQQVRVKILWTSTHTSHLPSCHQGTTKAPTFHLNIFYPLCRKNLKNQQHRMMIMHYLYSHNKVKIIKIKAQKYLKIA